MFEWLRVIASRIHGFLTPRRLDQDFEQELEALAVRVDAAW